MLRVHLNIPQNMASFLLNICNYPEQESHVTRTVALLGSFCTNLLMDEGSDIFIQFKTCPFHFKQSLVDSWANVKCGPVDQFKWCSNQFSCLCICVCKEIILTCLSKHYVKWLSLQGVWRFEIDLNGLLVPLSDALLWVFFVNRV